MIHRKKELRKEGRERKQKSSNSIEWEERKRMNSGGDDLKFGSDDQSVYLVPYRWWKEALDSDAGMNGTTTRGVLYVASSSSSASSSYVGAGPMKIINNIFNLDLVFNLTPAPSDENHHHSPNDTSTLPDLREYALVPSHLWLHALKWHSDAKLASTSIDDMCDVYPLQIRLSLLPHLNAFSFKISKRDNAVEPFRRASKIFTFDSESLRIWDFSGQTTLYLASDYDNFPKDSQRKSDPEILLELQIYGLSDSVKCRDGKRYELTAQDTNSAGSSVGSSSLLNGFSINTKSNFLRTNISTLCGRSYESGSLGLTGLQNLGNTCFMNSAIQCLAHTPKLVDYFLGDYSGDINRDNPLGMDGEISMAFGDLLRKLWAPGATPVPPRIFKSKLARFAPQFSGFNQHDSQELLAFLLDGLHEDLNRVKCKPYVEAKDGDGRLDEEVADEYWQNHLARNDSIIVDVCQGQYRSTLVCPVCKKVSVTFDPFMYLSLPLPSTTMRTMSLMVITTDGFSLPIPYTITVPKCGKSIDLIQALTKACALRANETLLVAEIFNNRIIRFLEEPTDSISLIRDDDRLVAYRLLKDVEKVSLVVFMHQQMIEQYAPGVWKTFGVPLVAMISEQTNGFDIRNLYIKLLHPFLMPVEETLNESNTTESTAMTVQELEDLASTISGADVNLGDEDTVNSSHEDELQFHLTDAKGTAMETKVSMNDPLPITGLLGKLHILVSWPKKLTEQYNTCMLSSLPEIFKPGSFPKKHQEGISLYKCLEAFLKEEPLGPEDMWYCPGCKKHQQASKKLDLWRLPEILVIHLKRFSYSRFMKNKLETYVEFPIKDLDLSRYMAYKCENYSKHYMLYAASNHYGSMGGGHYTAFVHHGGDRWYDFDDSHVSPVSEEKIKTSAAYVLFYRRVEEEEKR